MLRCKTEEQPQTAASANQAEGENKRAACEDTESIKSIAASHVALRGKSDRKNSEKEMK